VLTLARIVFFAFAALLILGGIAGFVEKRSIPSLASGIVCGGLGLYAAFVLPTQPKLALILGLVASVLAGGGMMPRLKDKETGAIKVWPAGTVVAVSALTAVVAAAGLLTGAAAAATTPAGSNATTGATTPDK